jgi:hypothetical protein
MASVSEFQHQLDVVRLVKYEEIRHLPTTHRRQGRLMSLAAVMMGKPDLAINGAAHHAVADVMMNAPHDPASFDVFMAGLLIQKSKIPGSNSWDYLRRSTLYMARHEGRAKVSKCATTDEWLRGHALVLLSTYLLDPMDPRTNRDMQVGLYTARMADLDEDPESYAEMSRDVFVYDSVMNEGAPASADWSLRVVDPAVM